MEAPGVGVGGLGWGGGLGYVGMVGGGKRILGDSRKETVHGPRGGL